jgi:hypothetical protein
MFFLFTTCLATPSHIARVQYVYGRNTPELTPGVLVSAADNDPG